MMDGYAFALSYTGCPGWGGVPEDLRGLCYYIGEINTGVPPGLGVPSIGGAGGGCINLWFDPFLAQETLN